MTDINSVAEQTSQLLLSYNSLLINYYDMFYNTTPMDITLSICDSDGLEKSVIVPNRAKDRTYIKEGSGVPENAVIGNMGSIYQDTTNGDIYIKKINTGNTGWEQILSKELLDKYFIKGNNSPEENIEAIKGAMYVDQVNGDLYIKTTSTGNTGWAKYISEKGGKFAGNISVPVGVESGHAVNKGQLDSAINSIMPVLNGKETIVTYELPIGTMIQYTGYTAPRFFIECAGQTLSRVDYPDLWMFAQKEIASGNVGYTVGNGSTTFTVPDMRGVFARGWDDGKGVDSGRSLGSFQDDQLESHNHMINLNQLNSNSDKGWGKLATGWEGAEGVIPDIASNYTGGNETRPKNVSVMYILKAVANPAINPIPTGSISYITSTSVPDGWLKANGAELNRTAYTTLFENIGTTYGVGNGSTTFNLPDLRGEFIRGYDDGRQVDADRVFGSSQSDAMRNLKGLFHFLGGDDTGGALWCGGDGALFTSVYSNWYQCMTHGWGNGGVMTFDASKLVPTANENRPRNVALLAIIKY